MKLFKQKIILYEIIKNCIKITKKVVKITKKTGIGLDKIEKIV